MRAGHGHAQDLARRGAGPTKQPPGRRVRHLLGRRGPPRQLPHRFAAPVRPGRAVAAMQRTKWTCESCGNLNWEHRDVCNRCPQTREQNEAAIASTSGGMGRFEEDGPPGRKRHRLQLSHSEVRHLSAWLSLSLCHTHTHLHAHTHTVSLYLTVCLTIFLSA